MCGVEVVHPLPCTTAAPPLWISPEASGSRSCSMDLARGGGEGHRIYRHWGVPHGGGCWALVRCERGKGGNGATHAGVDFVRRGVFV
jgi:hypothetical protein